MNTKTLLFFSTVILALIVLTLTTSNPAAAVSISSIPQHKGMVCIYCHETRGFPIGSPDDEDTCSICHLLRDNKALLEQVHSTICNNCHNIPNTIKGYHELHSVVKCVKCHGNGNATSPVIRPKISRTDCGGCHGATVTIGAGGSRNIHDAHQPVMDKACPVCHGSRPSSSAPITLQAGTKPQLSVSSVVSSVYAKAIDYRKYTLYEICKRLSTLFT
jgi:hypothetical protein